MRRILLAVLAIAGLGLGFAGASLLLARLDSGKPEPALVFKAELKSEQPWLVTLGAGWGTTDARGTSLAGKTAALTLALPAAARSDLVLDVTAHPAADGRAIRLEVAGNGASLGALSFASRDSRRLLLPVAVANRTTPLELGFRASEGDGHLIIEGLAIKAVGALGPGVGHLDQCSGEIIGWASAAAEPVPVRIRISGRPELVAMPSEQRADAERQGHGRNTGFRLRPEPPLTAGQTVEALFYDGRQMPGSPCRS